MNPELYPYLGAFLIGLSKAGFATGLGMLTTPLLATGMAPRLAIGILLPLLLFADFVTLSAFWKKWNLDLIKSPMLGALLGVATAMAFVTSISERLLRTSIGATALALTILLIIRNIWYPTRVYKPTWWEAALVGFAAGFSSTISHGAGPIMAIFFMAQKIEKKSYVATNAIFFTVLNLVKLPPYMAAGLVTQATLTQDLRFLPFIPVGAAVGWLANRALPQKAFEILVYVLLLLTALQLLFR
jgi:uncharacterized membrane protein YfcA